MYSRNYGNPENAGAYGVAQSLRRDEANAKSRESIPVKNFPEVGALAHFEREYGRDSQRRVKNEERHSTQKQNVDSEEESKAMQNGIAISDDAIMPNEVASSPVSVSASSSENASEGSDRLPTEREKSNAPSQSTFAFAERTGGIMSRLKKSLSRYTDDIFGGFGVDDFLLIAMLLLFLTDDNEENDPLIPIVLLALILF